MMTSKRKILIQTSWSTLRKTFRHISHKGPIERGRNPPQLEKVTNEAYPRRLAASDLRFRLARALSTPHSPNLPRGTNLSHSLRRKPPLPWQQTVLNTLLENRTSSFHKLKSKFQSRKRRKVLSHVKLTAKLANRVKEDKRPWSLRSQLKKTASTKPSQPNSNLNEDLS